MASAGACSVHYWPSQPSRGVQDKSTSPTYLQGRLQTKTGGRRHLRAGPTQQEGQEGQAYFLRLKKPLYGLKQAGRRWQEEP